ELALLIEGPTRPGEPRTEAENLIWASHYPTRAVFPMMALVKRVRESDLSDFVSPVLVLYSKQDQTVEPREIEAWFERIGSNNKTLEVVTDSEALRQHVLAGDARAPNSTLAMAQRMVRWVQGL
ncbi:hypothetical protein RZS08_32435, partial [Arthrospira platensis SPKY1]|nr:hypothetical protein [Arthrospira platensis SPKY1]